MSLMRYAPSSSEGSGHSPGGVVATILKEGNRTNRISISRLTLKVNNRQDCQKTVFSAELSVVAGGSLAETGSAGLLQLSLR